MKKLRKLFGVLLPVVLIFSLITPFDANAVTQEKPKWSDPIYVTNYLSASPTAPTNSIDSLYDGVAGYRFSGSSSASGELVFSAPNIKQFKATGCITGGVYLDFEVSSDGVTYIPINTRIINRVQYSYYQGITYLSEELENIYYIKVKFPSGSSWGPSLCNLYERVNTESIYNVNINPTNYYSSTLPLVANDFGSYNFSNAQGEVVYKSTDVITAFKIGADIGNGGWGGIPTFEVSSDGTSYTAINAAGSPITIGVKRQWLTENDYFGAIPIEKNIRYLKVKIPAFDLGIPAIRTAALKTIKWADPINVTSYITASPTAPSNSIDSIYDNVAGYRFSNSVSTYGELVFSAPDIKQFKVTGCSVGGVYLSFEVSADGANYTPINTKVISETQYSYYKGVTYLSEETEDIYYIKVKFPTGSSWGPSLCNLYELINTENTFNTSIAPLTVYSSTLPLVANSWGSYNFSNAQGEAVYKSNDVITAFKIGADIGNGGWGGVPTFEVSSDGVAYSAVNAAGSPLSIGVKQSWLTENDYYGAIPIEKNIHYIKVKIPAFDIGIPGIRTVALKTVKWSDAIYVTNYLSASPAAPTNSIDSIYDNVSGYRFSNSTSVYGELVFSAPDIKQFKVTGCVANGIHLSFEVSADGITYTPIDTKVISETQYSYYKGVTYLSKEAEDIYYIKVKFPSGSPWGPSLCNLYELVNTETTYNTNIAPLGYYSVTRPLVANNWGSYNFSNLQGEAVYTSTNVITAFKIGADIGNGGWGGTPSFEISSDGVTYSPVNAAGSALTVGVKQSWLTENDYYGAIPIERNIHYVKVKIPAFDLGIPAIRTVSFKTEVTPVTQQEIYYVDSVNGNDINSGLDKFKPAKTIAHVVAGLSSGDTLLLKRGSVFNENLSLWGIIDSENPLTISDYGNGEKPLISPASGDGISIGNCAGIILNNIRVTAAGGERGIRIITTAPAGQSNAYKNIQISNCDISNVAGNSTNNYETGGIVFQSWSESAPTWFEDILLEGNTIQNVKRTGIIFTSLWVSRPGLEWPPKNTYVDDNNGWYPSKNVVVRGNYINSTGGDGIVIIGSVAPLIEHNKVFYAQQLGQSGFANAGIWPQATNDALIQYNEVGYTQKPAGTTDAQGYDVDLSCKNTVIQYNYSHHNQGGFLLLCSSNKSTHTGTVVRNNLSVADGQTTGEIIAIVNQINDAKIYNNTIYVTGNVYHFVTSYSDPTNVKFYNNILFDNNSTANKLDLQVASGGTTVGFEYTDNIYYSTVRSGNATWNSGGYNTNPLLANPGQASNGLENGQNYIPASNSPALSGGLLINGRSAVDYFGKVTGSTAYIGAMIH